MPATGPWSAWNYQSRGGERYLREGWKPKKHLAAET
jgi:hypothetical protein